jgi:hypothetical protein
VRLDRVNKALHIRFIPNEKNRLYVAVNYLNLAVVGRQQLEVIESVVQEKALWPLPLANWLPPGHASGRWLDLKMSPLVRGDVLGACIAAVCVVAPAVGVSATLIGGTIAVAVVARRGETTSPDLSIRLWFACTLGFFVGTLLFAAFAELPAVWVALCICSPLLGTMVCAIDGALQSMT